ncbi:NAD(P)-dependent oxidoreductase [Nocardioides bizhenqiangii]|uniref:NAD(P)-binding oxidoreductase n=1 Tax=Nocardioides bizhenqiangii TaxID=3095076 RepID=A0ABZ0ZTG5_9ACTN|nr:MULTISPECIES: NAD(P)-binding oxidoreductase [unclassified Nocardioides]MDZ5621749.1 NAD(P)-binding oxidoreductase [Nocardioides sp. HM23]WQQ27565.1 NAD(P)-binding oxidoreductase [Nocardioides sp. HM61]
MKIAVLGATGGVGREVVSQALDQGHDVVAVSRHAAEALDLEPGDLLHKVSADVTEPAAVAEAISGCDAVIGTLGVSRGEEPGVLTAGARSLIAANPKRVVWLGAYGTGASAERAGALTRAVLKLAMKGELPDKEAADKQVLDAGGIVLHSGPFKNGAMSPSHRAVPLQDAPHRLFPARVARASVAACLLEAAAAPATAGVLVPLES